MIKRGSDTRARVTPLTDRDEAGRSLGSLRVDARRYPYLVIRWMAAVYGTAEIRIVAREAECVAGRHLMIVDPEHRAGDPLTPALRQRILEAAQRTCAAAGQRRCVVFAADDAVFVEPDGRAWRSDEPPHGGVRLDPGSGR